MEPHVQGHSAELSRSPRGLLGIGIKFIEILIP